MTQLQGWIEHEEGAAAALHVFLDGVHFGLLVSFRRAGDYQSRAVTGHFGFREQIYGLGVVAVFRQDLFEFRHAFAIAVVELVLAASRRKANRPGTVLQIANASSSDAFLGHALRFFSFGADLNDRGAEAANAVFARQSGVFVGIDVLHLQLGREIGVLIEQVLAFTKTRASIEVGDDCILLQAFDDLGSLVREAVALVRGGVVGLVVAVRENVV